MMGAELAARRKAAGLTQSDLAERAGIGRHAVSYWECKPVIDMKGWAVGRMAKALGSTLPDFSTPKARARTWAVIGPDAMAARLQAEIDARKAERNARRPVICGAKTRKGTTCRNKSEPGKQRCKYHGGCSTGARTPEGLARISEAQRRRWARWRSGRGQ